jgi:hypothetical protein
MVRGGPFHGGRLKFDCIKYARCPTCRNTASHSIVAYIYAKLLSSLLLGRGPSNHKTVYGKQCEIEFAIAT